MSCATSLKLVRHIAAIFQTGRALFPIGGHVVRAVCFKSSQTSASDTSNKVRAREPGTRRSPRAAGPNGGKREIHGGKSGLRLPKYRRSVHRRRQWSLNAESVTAGVDPKDSYIPNCTGCIDDLQFRRIAAGEVQSDANASRSGITVPVLSRPLVFQACRFCDSPCSPPGEARGHTRPGL